MNRVQVQFPPSGLCSSLCLLSQLARYDDLRKLPQIERKALLDLLDENDIKMPVLYSEHLTGDRQEMFEHATELNTPAD